MRIRKREIAKAGVFGTKDDPKVVTEKDLKEIEETFLEIRKAPVSLNGHHPDPSAPRMGNVVSVSYDHSAKSLSAEIEEDDALAESVDAGYYPDVSICARQRAGDGKMYLVHLAYLGEEAPAIKDLRAKIREPLGIAAADAEGCVIFPSPHEIRLSDQINPEEEDDSVTEKEAQTLREENERLKSEIKERDIALSDSAGQKMKADMGRLKAAMNEARINQVQQGRFLQIAGAFTPGKIIELSDGAGGTEKLGAIDALIKAVSAIPPPVQTGALNLGDLDDPGQPKRGYSHLRNKG